jgi:hypothetical protein
VNAVATATVLTLLAVSPQANSQWQQMPDKSIPRTNAGETDLTAPTPRAANGKPDLSGVWLPDGDPIPAGIETVEGDLPIPRHMANIMADLGPDGVEMRPWAAELFGQRLANGGAEAPISHCKPTGIPFVNAITLPYKIVQTTDLVLVLYEENTIFRQIFLDGRETEEDPLPRWMGYSTGTWDDDELVVETTGLIEESWLDLLGHPHTESLVVTERFRRRDAGHLEIEITVDDPETYAEPITYTLTTTVMPDDDLLEYFCTDNELSSAHYQ